MMEASVFGRRSGRALARIEGNLPKDGSVRAALEEAEARVAARFAGPKGGAATSAFEVIAKVRSTMTETCGILRDEAGLTRGAKAVEALAPEVGRMQVRDTSRAHNGELTRSFEAENMVLVAEAMLASALDRKESRGAHTRRDHPERDDERWLKHILVRRGEGAIERSYRPVRIDWEKHPPVARKY